MTIYIGYIILAWNYAGEFLDGFHRFLETSQVYWTGIISQYTLMKQSRLMGNIVIKQSWHLITSIYMFILIYFCLLEVVLGEGQSCSRPQIPPTPENLGIFVNLCTNSIIKCNFYTNTWNNLYPVSYGRLHPSHPNPVICILLASPT